MSLRAEQYRALLMSRDFLRTLATPRDYPPTRSEIRAEAARCLHHFPPLDDDGKPMFSTDNRSPTTNAPTP